MQVFLLLFYSIFSDTYNFVESSYSDALMKKGECEKASQGYFNDYIKTKNPLVASNYSLSLICLNRIKEAEAILDLATKKFDSVSDLAKKEELKLNYSFVKSLNFKFDESNFVLNKINDSLLLEPVKSLFYAVHCRNNIFLNNYNLAQAYCLKAYDTDNKSCFKASHLAKYYYYTEQFEEAVKIYEKIFDKCVDEDLSYTYSYSLYRVKKLDLALNVLGKNILSKRNKDLYEILNKR